MSDKQDERSDDVQRIADADLDFLPEFDIIKNPHKDDNWFSDIGGFGETGERIPYYEGYLKTGDINVSWISEGSKHLSIRNNSLWVLKYIDINGNLAAMLGHTFTDLMMHANLTLSTGE